MASILSEVLNVNHNAQQCHFRDVLGKVNGRIAGLKTELVEATETVFVYADGDIDRVTSWSVELTTVYQQSQDLRNQFEKDKKALESSAEEIDFTAEELEDGDKNIEILQRLVEVVRNIEVAVPDVDVHQAGRSLGRADDILQDLKHSFPAVEDEKWFTSIQVYVQDKMGQAQKCAMKQWNNVFKFETNGLVINQECCDITDLIDTIENTRIFKKVWIKFCDQVWQELLSKVCSLDYNVEVATKTPKEMNRTILNKIALDKTKYYDCDYLPTKEGVDMNLTLSDEDGGGDGKHIPVGSCVIKCKKLDRPIQNARDVFRNITNIISAFKDVFEDKYDIMDKMGATLSTKLCDALSTKCLKTLILKNSNGDFNKAVQELQAMQSFVNNLITSFNFNINTEIFEQLNSNFEGSFINQLREDLIVKIRILIKCDAILHTVETASHESSNDLAGAPDEIAALHRNPMKFPKCVVSQSIVEIVNLLKNHLKNFPDDLSMTDNAFNLYLAVVTVPKNESEAGDLVPLSAVLIHNNSLYLSHHASVSFPLCEDKIPLLRNKASQAYSFMMRSIRTKLNGMISDAMQGLDERMKSSVDEVHLKFQVIAAEFLRLDNLFKGILPTRVWKKTLATFVDHTVNEMCSKVLSWDDISANTAQELSESFTRFSVSVAELFKGTATSVREIDVITSQMVSKWQRFRLLTFVIKASMKEIEDKWVDGCGPLALAFNADEVRRLIRALFQNTERRAAFLASIK